MPTADCYQPRHQDHVLQVLDLSQQGGPVPHLANILPVLTKELERLLL